MHLDFIVPGFSKCGTTTLCALLGRHPDIYIPGIKEPNFFAAEFDRGWPWYESLFSHSGSASVHGEGSTFYSSAEFAEIACSRIRQYFPQARLIFIARNPLARLESSYREQHHSGYVYGIEAPYSIRKTLEAFPNMIADTLYWQRISTYRRHFHDRQIHVLFLEDLTRHPQRELKACFRFLKVDPDCNVELGHVKLNPAEQKSFDSRLLRLVRRFAWSRRIWNGLSAQHQKQLEGRFGLRKPFRGPVKWDATTLAWVRDRIADDAIEFLRFFGKSPDFWNLAAATRKAA